MMKRSQRMQSYDVSADQAKQLVARELDDVFVLHGQDLPHKGWASVVLENDEGRSYVVREGPQSQGTRGTSLENR